MTRREVIAALVRRQIEVRVQRDSSLEPFIGGTGRDGCGAVYAARSQEHAEHIHERRMASAVDLVACGACGYLWHSPEDRAQAEAADSAYALYREAEEQRERDEARLGPTLVAVNQRLLEAQAARASSASTCEQLTLLGAHANTRSA